MRQRRLLAYGTLGAMLATLLIASEPAAAGPTAPAAPVATAPAPDTTEPEPTRRVTLITGDPVSVTAGQLAVTPRAGVHFIRFRRGDADYVVPSDAIPLLKADRLDERLFNVTALLEFDFDKLPYLPLVVSDATAVHGLSRGPRLAAVDGFATKVPVADLATTWQTTRTALSGGKIWLDGVRESTLDVSVPMIGTPAAWSAGYDGAGVTVAVLDTGIDDTHPDLAGRVTARRNFVPEMETGLDLNGHGTHVASTVAGNGAASGGKYKGVAPGAALLDGKVCWNVQGRGSCSDSAILAAMQWAAESGAKVVNMSLGGPDEIGVDPLEQAINELSAEYGTLFVCSAGNLPLKPIPVGSPSTADAALSVANFDKNGALHWSSLRGPRVGDYAVKPEIGGPGTDIYAARSPSALGHLPEGPYVPLTGTSMASPHVAGAAALLLSANPTWSATQVRNAIVFGGTRRVVRNTAFYATSDVMLRIGTVVVPFVTGLRSLTNGKNVSVGSSGTQPLTPSKPVSEIGDSEKFTSVAAGDGYYAFASWVNGKYVSATSGGTGSLVASASTITDAERFLPAMNGDGTVSLIAKVNGKYVTAPNSGTSPLVASASTIGQAEKFIWASPAAVVALRAAVNSNIVTSPNGGAGSLIASATAVTKAEKFDMLDLGEDAIALRAHSNRHYVTVPTTPTSPLVANAISIGTSQRLWLFHLGDGSLVLQANANYNLVQAPNNGNSALNSNFDPFDPNLEIGPAQQFFHEVISVN
jgi:subtilisin family serine protease